MANFAFSLRLEINHTLMATSVAKRMDIWAAAFVFQMALEVREQSSLPWAIPGWKGRTHMFWAPRNQSHVDAHISCQGSQLGMLDAITGQYSYQNLFNFLQIVCMSTCQNTHPGKRWISLMQYCAHSTCPFVSLNCEAAALQLSRSCFDTKGSMTESHGDHGEKSRALRPKAEPTPYLCNIHSQKYGKKGDSLETSQTWLQVVQGEQLQGILLDMRVSRDPFQLPALQLFQRSNSSCASRGADFLHPSPRQRKASSNSRTAFQLISASFLILCWLCSRFKQHLSNKMIFHEPLWCSSPAPSHRSAAGSAVSSCFGPSMPCPKPQRSYPTALHWQKGCLENLAAHSASKSAAHTLLKGE